jgi:hypothetical protein
MRDIQALTPSEFKGAYVGKIGRCCCGCSGKHSNDAKEITRVLRTIQSNEDTAMVGETFVSANVGKKVYIAYFGGAK